MPTAPRSLAISKISYSLVFLYTLPSSSISFPISDPPTAQQALLPIQPDIPSLPSPKVLDLSPIAHDNEQSDNRADEYDNAQPRVVGAEIADLEDDVLKRADGGFRG
jgi:hypothetical protein